MTDGFAKYEQYVASVGWSYVTTPSGGTTYGFPDCNARWYFIPNGPGAATRLFFDLTAFTSDTGNADHLFGDEGWLEIEVLTCGQANAEEA